MAEPAVAVRAEESAVFARGVSRPWMMTAVVICIGPLMAAIAAALHNVYLVTGVLALVGLAVTWALPRGSARPTPHEIAETAAGGIFG